MIKEMSWAMMHTISLTFEAVPVRVIDLTWSAAKGKGSQPSVLISPCSCHLAQDVARSAVGHLGRQKVKERQMVLWLFGRMQKAESVTQLDCLLGPPLSTSIAKYPCPEHRL